MTGQALESLTVEAMLPESTAVIIECQTDSKARTLSDIRLLIKDFGGNVATTNHLFERKGRIVFGSPCGQGDEALFEQLIEAHTVGADFADGDKLVVLTEPAKTKDIAEIISQASTREIESRDIFWDPKPETKVDATSEVFADFVGRFCRSRYVFLNISNLSQADSEKIQASKIFTQMRIWGTNGGPKIPSLQLTYLYRDDEIKLTSGGNMFGMTTP